MNSIAACEQAAYLEGLAAGLARALTGVEIVAAPGGTAAVPADWTSDVETIPHSVAAREGIAFVRVPTAAEPTDTLTDLGVLLAAARLGATRRLADHAVAHLSGRTSGGEPTIRKQLVLGTLADLLTEVEALRVQLTLSAATAEAVADVHDRITDLDWEAAKLLGASGYLADNPGRSCHVSELVANCWVTQ
ncbi:acyl-CoA dehydrogenase family protein [Micromonospora sp. WMMD1102]|uniref:acyl-CoA dehydrogenase family protein n=1 Tax=Micromonospora sp. WMMD1102 TaxID=3016105 RepID=UPI0024153332|nr:acyl-CoA dehydrogenase family protein [Micromonospora sp. WMMD1102]MDG4785108.1 acyl-CoA dehydrogenase family protein [Micromonospora sp. WMMD1102]